MYVRVRGTHAQPDRSFSFCLADCFHKIFSHAGDTVKVDKDIRAALEWSSAGRKTPSLILGPGPGRLLGCVYLGGFHAVLNKDFLVKHKVRAIVNTAKGLEMFGPKYTNGVQAAKDLGVAFLELNWIDSREQVIHQSDLQTSVQFIHEVGFSTGPWVCTQTYFSPSFFLPLSFPPRMPLSFIHSFFPLYSPSKFPVLSPTFPHVHQPFHAYCTPPHGGH